MAPSRRKGAAKAAAAAAARREWKVGDLVLAKVKGFPAWPATVSEPEKWGYSADWKKVLVYFFGTQQIAFCNPADVEPFTEEKKQTLLTKRQGRSADFVRAVQEIIDSYEKSKKQDRVDLNSGDDIAVGNSGNSLESSAHFEMKDQRETSHATITGRNDPSLQTDDALDASQNGSSHDKEVVLEPLANSRKTSGSLRSRKCIMLEMAPSLERSRSSSQLDSCPFQNFMMSMDDGDKSARDMSIDAVRDRSVQRNKRIKKSPDGSQSDNADSSAFVNNVSIEDNGSEIITADSDSFSLNEGSTLDSGYQLEHSETAQCLEADVGSRKGLDFRINAVVIKKKRKQNRKRATSEVAETARMETEAGVDIGMHDNSQNSQNACQSEMQNKEDGDEHLPLVKRARVRMGKQSSYEERNDNSQVEERTSKEAAINLVEEDTSFCQAVERTSTKVGVDTLEPISPFTNFSDGFPAHRDSFVLRGTSYIASPVKDCTLIPENWPQLLKVKESADCEAALPICKRLHRALEAMSENAAEDYVSTMKTSINCSSVSSDKSSFQMVNVSRDGNGSEEQSVDSPGNIVSAFSPGSKTILEESNKSSLDAKIFNDSESSKCQEPCQDVFPEATGHCHGKDFSGLSCGNHNACTSILAESPVCVMPNLDTKQASVPTNDGSLDQLLLPKDEANSHDIELKEFGAGTADKGSVSPNLISQANEAAKVASQNATDGLHFNIEEAGCEDSETLTSQIDNNSQANAMCEVAKDVQCDQEQKEASYASLPDYHLSDKDGLAQTIPFQADRVESPAQISPSNTVICHVSTSESTNFIQNSNSSSPNSLSHPKKSACSSVDEEKIESMVPQRMKSIGKSNNSAEAHAVLSSFEAILGSLTRTRESIGRATRIAIDCAKLGASAKVLEILARTLESESNLHRRVDLFFLVDSIAQCSRGLKGDVGGVYPSVIQTVLPRLLSAAAPSGSFAHENQRQCLKVLRLWLERRILPESIIRHHIRELDSFGLSAAGPYARRSARTERPLDDPVRDMEGMLVDEYGSNSSFQLPGFCMPRMLKDEDDGTDSDGGFEAVTPERNIESPKYQETNPVIEKHTHILEDVDGELEMEDVAPSCEVEMSATNGIAGGNAAQNSHNQFERCLPQPTVPPLPSSLPLPSSPPPLPPPPPHAVAHSCEMPDPCTNSHNLQDDSRQSMTLHSMAPSLNPSVSNAVHFHTSECRDQMPVQCCGSTRSFSSYPARQMNFVRHTDGPGFHHKPYPPRPPHPPPCNHFSYVQASQHVKSRRGLPPPSYSHRFHPSHSVDGGNFYNNHERMRPDPYEFNDGWRYPPTDFPGPRYPDKAKASYAPVPYDAPPREPRFHHQDWQYHARGMHHRNFMPSRPSECVIPVENRGPSMWWPR